LYRALIFFCCVLFLVVRPVAGRQVEPLFGIWRLNLAESDFASGPSAYSRVTCKIEPLKDGMKVVYDMVGVRGGVTHWEWTGRIDGNHYALQGVEEVITNAYTRTGDRTYTMVFKVDGRAATTNHIVISPDGRTMTVTTAAVTAKGGNVVNTVIYNRQ
jgi:hypothetical protein